MTSEKAYHDEQRAIIIALIKGALKTHTQDLTKTTGTVPPYRLPVSGPAAPGSTGTGYPPADTSVTTGKIADDAVTFAKMQNIATDRLIGRDTAGTGDPEQLTVSGGVEFTGSGGIQRSALTGDVTASAGSGATTIPNDTVTYAKMQNISAASRLLGRGSAAGAGDPQEISLGSGLSMSGTTLSSSGSGSAFGWFNVKDYGAVGDGTTDDTSAINSAIAALNSAGGGVLYVPKGTYKCTGALTTITAACRLMGDTSGGGDGTTSASVLRCASATAAFITITAPAGDVQYLSIVNTAGSTPSAGGGIIVDSSNPAVYPCIHFESVAVYGFWINIDVRVGTAWTMRNVFCNEFIKYGLKIRNTYNADAGDYAISDSLFASSHGADAGIRLESSGGAKITNCKFNGSGTRPVRHIDLDGSATSPDTVILIVSNCSFENSTNNAVRVVGPHWFLIAITGCEFGDYGSSSSAAVSVASTNGVILSGNVFYTSGTIAAAISLSSVTNYVIEAQPHPGYTALLSATSSTGIDNSGQQMTNPMTTEGDVIYGGASGVATRLAVGASGKILTSNGTDPVWGNGPLTTRGDIITAGASGAIQRVALGSSGKVLSSDGTDAVWGNGPLTTKGDLIAGGASGAISRLGVGSDNQVLTADSAQTLGVKWATPAGALNWSVLTNGNASSPELVFAGGDVIMVTY